MDRPDIVQQTVTPKDTENSRLVKYQYDINDNLRNNRPGIVKPKCTYDVDNLPENVEQVMKTKDEKSPLVSLKT
ncbi:hypothetical protein RRG08_007336 [Elysia crispata]|uniref:Uncharacterized protein n=1 Tax=Elysia crispata TaxID=231223 RepID=A0AAE1E2W0_9GAST|nr:hypothetical protein RRG08_007336 [Elysia crispata]